jgi:hypothetical protein
VLFFYNFCCNHIIFFVYFIEVIHSFGELNCRFPVFSALRVLGKVASTASFIGDDGELEFIIVGRETIDVVLNESAQSSLNIDPLIQVNILLVVS